MRTRASDLNYTIMDFINQNLPESTERWLRVPGVFPQEYSKKDEYSLAGKERKYTRQFFTMYEHRLAMLKPRVDRAAHKEWGHNTRKVNDKFIQHKAKILDIVSGELCWVSGTIFADMKHKLNIFKDVEKGVDDLLPAPPTSYVAEGEESVIMIEDESGRAILHNPSLLQRTSLVTGCVVAVLGIEVQAGVFEIMEVINPTPAPQTHHIEANEQAHSEDSMQVDSDDQWIAFVSGLHFDKEANMDLRVFLLQQWLAGELGSAADAKLARNIVRLVVAGNSIAQVEPELNTDFLSMNNFGSKNTSRFLAESLVLFNDWLSAVMVSLPVTLMPGEKDPCEICLPQQPMHKSLFGKNAAYVDSDSFTCSTNPSWLQAPSGLRILATSGQNIDDIRKYQLVKGSGAETLTLMGHTILWQNIAPTAPDTLYCYPFDDKDPFTLDETPNLYVVGNQPESASTKLELNGSSVTLVSVSEFRALGQIMLVNTRTLEVKKIGFGVKQG